MLVVQVVLIVIVVLVVAVALALCVPAGCWSFAGSDSFC